MKNPVFQFKQFSIRQDKCAMKIGTDAVLLATVPKFDPVETILEIGSGSGVISMMLAQQMLHSVIDAVESDNDAYEQSLENVFGSPWNERIHIIHSDFNEFQTEKKYDLIISNPPYFKNALKSGIGKRDLARHSDENLIINWIQRSSLLLNDNGIIAMILPVESLETLIQKALQPVGLKIQKLIYIHSFPESKPVRMILLFDKKSELVKEESFVIYMSKNHYSLSYVDLMKEYFTIFG